MPQSDSSAVRRRAAALAGRRARLADGRQGDVEREVAHLEAELGVADLDDVAELEDLFLDRLAVDEGTAAAAVADDGDLVAVRGGTGSGCGRRAGPTGGKTTCHPGRA